MTIAIIGNGIAANKALQAIRSRDRQSRVMLLSEEPELAYSACLLPRYLAGQLTREQVHFKMLKDYQQMGADLTLNSRVMSIDPDRKLLQLEDRFMPYERLILATGSEAILPSVPGAKLHGNFVFKTLADTDAILSYPGERFIVVGSGPIGVEASIALRKRGKEVTLVEQLGWVMPRVFDVGPAHVIQEHLEAMGILIRTGQRVTAVTGSHQVAGVLLETESLSVDGVIWAVGMRPKVELARNSEIQLGPTGGIQTNEQMMTSFPDIFACGDCVEAVDVTTGKPVLNMLWHSAGLQGAVAGQACTGVPGRYTGATTQVVLEVDDLHAGSVGATAESFNDEADVYEWRGRNDYHHLIVYHGRIVGAQSIGNLGYLGSFQAAIRQGVDPLRWKRITRAVMEQRQVPPWLPVILPFIQRVK